MNINEVAYATDDHSIASHPVLRVMPEASKVIVTHSMMEGGGVSPHGSLVVYTGGSKVVPAGEGDDGGVQSFVTTTYDLSTVPSAQSLAVYAGNSAHKLSGTGKLTNYGLLVNVVNGDDNWAYYGINGAFYNAGEAIFGDRLTAQSFRAGRGYEFQVANTGEVTLGRKVQSFTVAPTNGTANIAVGANYSSGAAITTKNTSPASATTGIDLAMDTTLNPNIGGGLMMWRGPAGGYGGSNEAGIAFSGGPSQYIVGSTAGDMGIFNTTPAKKILLSADGTGYTIGAQLDGNGVLQAKAVKTGATMGTGATWTSGRGSPQGVVVGNVGDMYTRTDGGPGTTLYVKEGGSGTADGWAAK